MKSTSFRFTQEDMQKIEVLKDLNLLPSDIETIRFALTYTYAHLMRMGENVLQNEVRTEKLNPSEVTLKKNAEINDIDLPSGVQKGINGIKPSLKGYVPKPEDIIKDNFITNNFDDLPDIQIE